MRNHDFLQAQLQQLLDGPFADMPRPNPISIAFGRRAKRRFGSIRLRDGVSQITINGLFRDESIPEAIIQATIAHELCHYAHGFSSTLPRKYRHPHQGGVIARELAARGLAELHRYEKRWTKMNWARVVREHFGVVSRRPRRRATGLRRRRPARPIPPLQRLLRYLVSRPRR